MKILIIIHKNKTQMSLKISETGSINIPSFIVGDFDVLIEYKGKSYALGEVTNYESLCEEIEKNLKSVKVQDLEITYEVEIGKLLAVQNQKNFIYVCKRARQKVLNPDETLEVCLTCTLVTTEVPVPLTDQMKPPKLHNPDDEFLNEEPSKPPTYLLKTPPTPTGNYKLPQEFPNSNTDEPKPNTMNLLVLGPQVTDFVKNTTTVNQDPSSDLTSGILDRQPSMMNPMLFTPQITGSIRALPLEDQYPRDELRTENFDRGNPNTINPSVLETNIINQVKALPTRNEQHPQELTFGIHGRQPILQVLGPHIPAEYLNIPPSEIQNSHREASFILDHQQQNTMNSSVLRSHFTDSLTVPSTGNQYPSQGPPYSDIFRSQPIIDGKNYPNFETHQNFSSSMVQNPNILKLPLDQFNDKNVNVSKNFDENNPTMALKAQDAARCACNQFLNPFQSQSGICPNVGCMLQANQTVTVLWSCSQQKYSCGRYCWMCVQTLLRNCQWYTFQDLNQMNEINTIRVDQQFNCQVKYNPLPTPQIIVPITFPPISKQEEKILGLDQKNLELLEKEVVDFFKSSPSLEDWWIDLICEDFKLDQKRPELIEFCKKFYPQIPTVLPILPVIEEIIEFPILPKMKAYKTKLRIIEFILKNELTPTLTELKNSFEGLKKDKLCQFKESYQNFNAITFEEKDLCEEEIKNVSYLIDSKKSQEQISKDTLIHINLVKKLCLKKLLKQEPGFFQLIQKYTSFQTNEEVIELLVKDNNELVKVLIQIYEVNKEEYIEITQKLKDENFAENFESSKELAKAKQLIDEQSALPIEQKLGLTESDLEQIKKEMLDYFKDEITIKDWIIEALCEQFSLNQKRSELKEFCNKFNPYQYPLVIPTLPKITTYEVKYKIIQFILKNEQIPSITVLKKSYEGLKSDQLTQFKVIYEKFYAISFKNKDLYEQEIQRVSVLIDEKQSMLEISKDTLIHIYLVKQLCVMKWLKEEPQIFDFILKHTSFQNQEEVSEFIVKDHDELVKVLIQIYEVNKEEYLEITQKLKDKNFAENFESSKVLAKAKQQIDEQSTIPIEQKLGLTESDLKELEQEVVEFFKKNKSVNDKFISDLCEKFSLNEKRLKLQQFCEKYNKNQISIPQPVIQIPIVNLPTLPKINVYSTKQRIIDILKSEKFQIPAGYTLQMEFEGLSGDQICQFKKCKDEFHAISFLIKDLFEEEIQCVTDLIEKKQSIVEISQDTLIDILLVKRLWLSKELDLLMLIHKHTSFLTNEEVIEIIVKDVDELVKVLIQIYKVNKEEYFQIFQKLIEQNLAKNFESSQELAKEIHQIDELSKIPIEKKLGLDQNDLEKLKSEVDDYFKRYNTVVDKFFDYLCKTFSLNEKRSELREYCQKYNPHQITKPEPIIPVPILPKPSIHLTTLPKINAYSTKQRIIEFIKSDDQTIPKGERLNQDFEGLNGDQLCQFKKCYENFGAISFERNDLFIEEIERVSNLILEQMSMKEISDETLIHINLIKRLLIQKWLEEKPGHFELIRKHTSFQTIETVIELIIKDSDELVMVLIEILKENKQEQLKITQMLINQKFAKNFEASQELVRAKNQIDANPPIEQQILGLDSITLEKLRQEVIINIQESKKIDEKCLNFICKKYLLHEKKSELQDFCQNLVSQQILTTFPILPKIETYKIKENVIKLIKNGNETPLSEYRLESDFTGLLESDIKEFRNCYQKHKAISFTEVDLYEQERIEVFNLQRKKVSIEEISMQTLIYIDLVIKVCDQNLNKMRNETELFNSIRKHFSCITDEQVIEKIFEDNINLVNALLKIYKNSREEYYQVTETLRKNQFAINFEKSDLQRLIWISQKINLGENTDLQKEAQLLLDHFYKTDLEVYLMVLHDFTSNEQCDKNKNIETIILNQKHKDIPNAVAQLLILEEDSEKKKQVIKDRLFIDDREITKLKELQDQIKTYFEKQAEQNQQTEVVQFNFGAYGNMLSTFGIDMKQLMDVSTQQSQNTEVSQFNMKAIEKMLESFGIDMDQIMDDHMHQNQNFELPKNGSKAFVTVFDSIFKQLTDTFGDFEENSFKEGQFEKLKKNNDEQSEGIKMIQAICNITNMKISLYSKSDLSKKSEYQPESLKELGTLHLVKDELQKVFYVMIQFENEKKIISNKGLQVLKTKHPYLFKKIPQWLEIFIQLPSLRIFLNDQKDDSISMLEAFSTAQNEFLKNKDESNKNKLYDATMNFNLESQLMQEWFSHYQKVDNLAEFCNFSSIKSTRQKPEWANAQVDKIQKYFPMNASKKTLENFNRVQTYKDPDARKLEIERLKSQPKQLTQFYINTHFGVILRKDDMTKIQSELAKILDEPTITLRFLISFLLQSSDFGLRARLDNYLSQYKSVPLIMNCQQMFKINQSCKIYNQELVFSISEVEGVGALAFGVGKNASNPCGKSQISNLIVTPLHDIKSFDVQDLNVFSNGQIDVFFEKCYQDKNGWVFMDGQGKISEQSLMSVLPLTNIVFIHFMEKDENDVTSVAELVETIQLIKQTDPDIQVCLLIRDCTRTQELNREQQLNWLSCRDKVDQLISLKNIQNENRLEQKSNLIEKVILYFYKKVRELKQNKSKFTKKNFLNGFCASDRNGKVTHQRIMEILKLSEEFLKEVQVSKDNVFCQSGLTSLKIKDQIREISVKLNSFEFLTDENQQSALKREIDLKKQKKVLTDQLLNLEVNEVMRKFWNIVIHNDAVQIKIEVSKSLAKFTQDNIQKQISDKNIFIEKKKRAFQSLRIGGMRTDEEIQKDNDEYKQQMRQFEDEIFKRSQSLEYHQRNLNCVMLNSKVCNYWSDNLKKLQFKKAVKQQMLDGDTFELVDGRNLEMKAEIIREIVGSEIDLDHTKCIVVCVIGPQSTGKSTLMNFCFGTQFLASTGRCTQGIYFTLQKIPPEMRGSSEVEYLIILDTEGLNSPERAEGEKNESEYDRKIVLFTLLCSDFLIINSSGDMSLQMKELIKICAVRYDELRAYSKVPKILYTFVKNSDNNPKKFEEQIISLKSDVIESSNEKTIEMTAEELMQINDDSIKVLGSAYDQKLIEKDSEKGIFKENYINQSAPQFGVDASKVWKQVQNFIESGKHQFRQIGKWLLEAEEHWRLIDKHGAKLTQFGNVLQMKNDKKIKLYINQLWQSYINTQIQSKDSQKAMEKCQELYEKERDQENIKPLKQKFIEENSKEKDDDYQNFILNQYSNWTKEHSQRNITVGAEQEIMKECKLKMNMLKEDYECAIENKLKELRMTHIHTSGVSEVYRRARQLCQDIKKLAIADQDAEILRHFEEVWGELEKEISSESQIEQMRKTNCEYLCKTFKSVNKYMEIIKPVQFDQILLVSKTKELYRQSTLPEKLVEYIVAYIKRPNMQEKKGQNFTSQFKLEESQLAMLDVVEKRIFGLSSEPTIERYLPLRKMLQVDYTYFVINDIYQAFLKSSVFGEILNILQQKKEQISHHKYYDDFRYEQIIEKVNEIDDKIQIQNKLTDLFIELGQAGFGLEVECKETWIKGSKKMFVRLDEVNVEALLKKHQIENNEQRKKQLVEKLREEIRFDEKIFKTITPRVESLMRFNQVKIPNQSIPNISLEQHKKLFSEKFTSKHTQPKPKLSYHFSQDDDAVNDKINVKKFLQERFLEDKFDQYQDCLITPKEYEISDEFKWKFLSELANAVVDWVQIVLDIEQKVLPQLHKINFEEQKTLKKEQDIMKFDLKSVLQRSQINIQAAEIIQSACVQPIQHTLNDELRQKLSLHVDFNLSGDLTWVACVIIWFCLQENVVNIFNREIEKIKDQKIIVLEKFKQIAKGQKTATTANCAEEIFGQTFQIFNEFCLNEFNSRIVQHLESQGIRDKFDTVNVYKQLDETYIAQADTKDYQNQIKYLKEPVTVFQNYVDNLKKNLIVDKQEIEMKNYKQKVIENLEPLQERLENIQGIFKLQQGIKNDFINFFDVLKAGKKVESNEEKEEIESQMSPILLKTLRDIISGSYTVSQQMMTLNFNDEAIEYGFSVRPKDLAKNIQGSPYNDLQKLVIDKSQPLEFLNIFFKRLDLCINSTVNGVCTDINFMVGKLNELVQAQIQEIKALTLDEIMPKFKNQDDIISSYTINAVGCTVMCKFCNRKCELASHQDNDENHNCDNRGHGLRVFGGGILVTSWNESYPSLTTCDEIVHDTQIRVVKNGVSDVKLWSEVHKSRNTNWTTKYNKFLPDGKINEEWLSINLKLEQFWKVNGPRYCKEMNYTFIEAKNNQLGQKASQMMGSSVVIICLDESNSMFNSNDDFDKAVQAAKQLEQYLKKNHFNPEQVQIQLWFNDCRGVIKVYTGQLSGLIPQATWIREGCQGDLELIKGSNEHFNYGQCGQFTGAVRILNEEVNNILGSNSNNYESVYWFFFTDGGNEYPKNELNQLQKTMINNRERWTFQGKHKLQPMIITNQMTVSALVMMKDKINEIMKEIWQVDDACTLKQDVKTDNLAATMIEQFTFTN